MTDLNACFLISGKYTTGTVKKEAFLSLYLSREGITEWNGDKNGPSRMQLTRGKGCSMLLGSS